MNRRFVGVAVLSAILGLDEFSRAPRAQQTTLPLRPATGVDGLPPIAPELPRGQKEKQEKMQNDDRQKQLVADTEKLLQLATELHTDVAMTNKNVLSMDVLKKADEIEKLAHAVKTKMRG